MIVVNGFYIVIIFNVVHNNELRLNYSLLRADNYRFVVYLHKILYLPNYKNIVPNTSWYESTFKKAILLWNVCSKY